MSNKAWKDTLFRCGSGARTAFDLTEVESEPTAADRRTRELSDKRRRWLHLLFSVWHSQTGPAICDEPSARLNVPWFLAPQSKYACNCIWSGDDQAQIGGNHLHRERLLHRFVSLFISTRFPLIKAHQRLLQHALSLLNQHIFIYFCSYLYAPRGRVPSRLMDRSEICLMVTPCLNCSVAKFMNFPTLMDSFILSSVCPLLN